MPNEEHLQRLKQGVQASNTWHEYAEEYINLSGVDLSGAQFFETTLGSTDLTAAKGLDLCAHYGPSTIDYRTVAKSAILPLAFLRGCGLPDALIDSLPSRFHKPNAPS